MKGHICNALVLTSFLFALSACGGDDATPASANYAAPEPVTQVIAASTEAIVRVGDALLTIGAGAVLDGTEITVVATVPDPAALPAQGAVEGFVYDFGPDGLAFDAPAEISLPLSADAAADPTTQVAYLDEQSDEWVGLPTIRSGSAAIAHVQHFTTLALVSGLQAKCGVQTCEGPAQGSWKLYSADTAPCEFSESPAASCVVNFNSRNTLKGASVRVKDGEVLGAIEFDRVADYLVPAGCEDEALGVKRSLGAEDCATTAPDTGAPPQCTTETTGCRCSLEQPELSVTFGGTIDSASAGALTLADGGELRFCRDGNFMDVWGTSAGHTFALKMVLIGSTSDPNPPAPPNPLPEEAAYVDYVPHMPFGPNASQTVYVSNLGDKAAEISVTAHDRSGTEYALGVVTQAPAGKVTKLSPRLRDALEAQGFSSSSTSFVLKSTEPVSTYWAYNLGSSAASAGAESAGSRALAIPSLKCLPYVSEFVMFQNVGPETATATVTVIPDGSDAPTQDELSIPPMQSVKWSGCPSSGLPGRSATVTSDQPLVGVVYRNSGGSLLSYRARQGGAPELLIPYMTVATPRASSTVTVMNLGETAATVHLDYTDRENPTAPAVRATRTIGAGKRVEVKSSDLAASTLSHASISISQDGSSVPLAVQAHSVLGSDFVDAQVVPRAAMAKELTVPYMPFDPISSESIHVTSYEETSISITAVDDRGNTYDLGSQTLSARAPLRVRARDALANQGFSGGKVALRFTSAGAPISVSAYFVRGSTRATVMARASGPTGPDVCDPNPCVNGGSCVASNGTFVCQCPDGFIGETCLEVGGCASAPCLNGGTCTDGDNDVTCACASGFLGDRCEIPPTCFAIDRGEKPSVSDVMMDIGTDVGPHMLSGTWDYTFGAAAALGDKLSFTIAGGTLGGTWESNLSAQAGTSPSIRLGLLSISPTHVTYRVTQVDSHPDAPAGTTVGLMLSVDVSSVAITMSGDADVTVTGSMETAVGDILDGQGDRTAHIILRGSGSVCLNGGTCSDDGSGGPQCACAAGYSGDTCAEVGDCGDAPCLNGGTCTDGDNGFICACADGYTGDTCAETDDCADDPCANGGTCTDGDNAFTCVCADGYSGDTCETNIDECASDPCANGGTCTDGDNAFTCVCADGYSGDTCETNIDECASDPCANGGTCTDGDNAFTCACANGYSGDTCETNIDECASAPCANGGTCTDGDNAFTCVCADGYSGDTCETNIDECASDPCANGGTCTDGDNAFTCVCADGYSGDTCETNIDECASDPCANGGTCTDGDNAFTCVCADGYSGDTCETNIDECASDPCANGGTCTDGDNAFTCVCADGYSGDTCETNIDECASDPCANGGTCTDGDNAFTCVCADGYSGDTCETNIDECASDPCANGGTCTDGDNAFTCVCADGYSGDTCETNIDECASDPCANGGTCTDGDNAFTCACADGYSGDTCAEFDDCAAAPCLNAGVCSDGDQTYVCSCPEGYSGANCENVAEGGSCSPTLYNCGTNNAGPCIANAGICDGVDDCGSGFADDERPDLCDSACGSDSFSCPTTATLECVPRGGWCDKTADCSDGSDETGCCKEFQCATGFACIADNARCDGTWDCPDGEDEAAEYCGSCPPNHFSCGNGSGGCLPASKLCDGVDDCQSGYADDEGPDRCGACASNEFYCGDAAASCETNATWCDGSANCLDASDELGCCESHQCGANDNYACLQPTQVNDGVADCADGSDEPAAAGCAAHQEANACDADPSCMWNGSTCVDGSGGGGCAAQFDSNACLAEPGCAWDGFMCTDGPAGGGCATHMDETECNGDFNCWWDGFMCTDAGPCPPGDPTCSF